MVRVAAILQDTGEAILVQTLDKVPREVWLPLSQVENIHRESPIKITIPEWLAEDREL